MDVSGFVHHLKSHSTDSEVWFDSSPLAYTACRNKLLRQYPEMQRYINELLPAQFAAAYSGISGATTNPTLISQALHENAAHYRDFLLTLPASLSAQERARRLYDQLIVDGAHDLLALWHQSGQRSG